MRITFFCLLLFSLLFQNACQPREAGQTTNGTLPSAELLNPEEIVQLESRLMRLTHAMTGDFNNFEQAAKIRRKGLADSYTLGFEEDQRIHTRRVWPNRTDAVWIYSEVILEGMPESPLLQKLMGINKISPDTLAMYTYVLPQAEKYIGEWKKPIEERFATLSPTNLEQMRGCITYLMETQKGTFESVRHEHWCEQRMGKIVKTKEYISYYPERMEVRYDGVDSTGNYIWKDPKDKRLEMLRQTVVEE